MPADRLSALADLAGRTVVAAATTDAWETAQRGLAQMLGRGDAKQARLARQWLAQTYKQLTVADQTDAGRTRAALAQLWTGRLSELLEEHRDAEVDLRALVQEIQAALPAETASASDNAIAADGDVNAGASSTKIKTAVARGNIAPPDIARQGLGELPAASEPGVVEAAGVATVQGASAVGQPVDQPQRLEGRPVRLAPRPAFLMGREGLLAELDTRFAGGDGLRARTVTLCGLGGSGKTSVAVEYAYHLLDEAGMVWQFAAEDAIVLAAGFADLAAELGAQDLLDVRDPVDTVHRVLAAFPADWLLLFDNAPDRETVEAFVPPAGPGRVLITSQNECWPADQSLDVPVLDLEVGAEFLTIRTGDPDKMTARELAGQPELGGLPLALEQAAAHMRATGVSLAGYLASFRQRRAGLLASGGPADLPGPVATTWTLAFERLEQAHPSAVALLRLLAFCGPEAIPIRLLLQPRPELTKRLAAQVAPFLVPLLEDQSEAKGAIAALRQCSLITPAGDESVSVHHLVQAVTVLQMPRELAAAWRQATADVIEAALPANPEQPQTWPDYTTLLPHAHAVLPPGSRGMTQIVRYLSKRGTYPAAIELGQRVLKARAHIIGPEHPDTLATRDELAYWTGQAGDAGAARDQFAALLPVAERALGPEHSDTLTNRHNLANFVGYAGDAGAARDQFAALLPVRERVSGSDHPETLAARFNLAYWTGRAGDAARTRDQLAALLPVRERVSGPDHPETLLARKELAYWTGQAGDAGAARDQFAALLPVREGVSGPDDRETLAVRKDLAYWTGRAGDAVRARDHYAALLGDHERVLGPADSDTLAIRASLAYWTAHTGDAAGARDQYAALLPDRVRVLGPEHPDTLATRHQLAYWTAKAGDEAAARAEFAALLPVRERVLGAEHPDTRATRTSLAHLIKESRSGHFRRGLFRRAD